MALLFSLQGIPCVSTAQSKVWQRTVNPDGTPNLIANESVREALWGKTPVAFDEQNPVFTALQSLANLRTNNPALSYGRIYFREVSGNGTDFGQSSGNGGIVAFSRILVDREILIIANTSFTNTFSGWAIQDRDINATPHQMTVAFSNLSTTATGTVQQIAAANFYANGSVSTAPAAALPVLLKPNEVQILTPL